jgi:phenol 2-monooxygenase (NADPH)
MIGDTSDSVWGVMDVFPLTDFPDIRKLTLMQSDEGSLLIIPREGGSMVRFYIELPLGMEAKDVKLEHIQSKTRQIFRPYTVDFAGTFWWSAYSIGQRIADHFSKDNRIFLTGDACHTHSPKAGQGLNVSLQDGYNIGWKLSSVLKGQTGPDLLRTYNVEREKVAATLIDFDKMWAKQMSSNVKDDPVDFGEIFVRAGAFTAGVNIVYDDSSITQAKGSSQHLATKLTVGMRFSSAQVVRFCDAKAMPLVKAIQADGRWRIVIFAGDISEEGISRRLNEVGYASN